MRRARTREPGSHPARAMLLIVPAILLLLQAAARAQGSDPAAAAAAERLEEEGARLFRAGAHLEAAARYRAAYRLDPLWEYAWNLARALEEAKQAEQAVQAFEEVLALAQLPAGKRQEGGRRLTALRQALAAEQQAQAEARRLAVAGLALECTPAGATVRLLGPGGAVVEGPCPLRREGLAPGQYTGEARAAGHRPAALRLELKGGALACAAVVLEPLPGTLLVACPTAGGEVRMDGRVVGRTPLGELELPPGPHEVQVAFPGRPTWTQRVTLAAGSLVTVEAPGLPAAAPPGEPARRTQPPPAPRAAEARPPSPAAGGSTGAVARPGLPGLRLRSSGPPLSRRPVRQPTPPDHTPARAGLPGGGAPARAQSPKKLWMNSGSWAMSMLLLK